MSQTRSVLSSEEDTINLPPGCQTTPRTQLSCPISVNKQIPTETSHTLIVLSRDPETRKGPARLLVLFWIMFMTIHGAEKIKRLEIIERESVNCKYNLHRFPQLHKQRLKQILEPRLYIQRYDRDLLRQLCVRMFQRCDHWMVHSKPVSSVKVRRREGRMKMMMKGNLISYAEGETRKRRE